MGKKEYICGFLSSAKSPEDILFKEEITEWIKSGIFECHITVDSVPDGVNYDDNVGLITTLIPPIDVHPADSTTIIIGPSVMYKYVINTDFTCRQIQPWPRAFLPHGL